MYPYFLLSFACWLRPLFTALLLAALKKRAAHTENVNSLLETDCCLFSAGPFSSTEIEANLQGHLWLHSFITVREMCGEKQHITNNFFISNLFCHFIMPHPGSGVISLLPFQHVRPWLLAQRRNVIQSNDVSLPVVGLPFNKTYSTLLQQVCVEQNPLMVTDS